MSGEWRTTVTIPLFRAAGWFDVIVGNVERLRPHARLLISDATGDDDTLDRLREHLGEFEGLTYLGPRDLPAGWVPHCNDLLARVTTEFVMWLPQDDDIDPGWVLGAQSRLDDRQDAVLATGPLVDSRHGEDDAPRPLDLLPELSDDDRDARVLAGLRETLTGRTANLGLVYRAVLRRKMACPLPLQPESGEWADVLWALEMLTRGAFIANPDGTYVKRRYAGATHYGWRDLRTDPMLRAVYLPAALAALPSDESAALLVAAWTAERNHLTRQLSAAQQRRDDALARLRTAEGR